MTNELNIVRILRPEDIREGMFVAVLYETIEVYPPNWWDPPPGTSPRPVRLACSACADGEARRVMSICLPFVQVEDARGDLAALDVRRHALVELAEMYGLEAFTRP